HGPGNRDLSFGGKSITVRSASGNPRQCTIDCDSNDLSRHRAFHFTHGEGSGAVVEGIRIINGRPPSTDSYDWGGAIAWLTASFAKTKHVVRRLAILNAPHPALFLDQLTFRQLRRSWYMLFFQLPHLPEWLLRRDDFAFVRKIFSHTQALRKRISDADFAVYKEALSRPFALTSTINYYRAVVRENPFLLKRRVSPVEAETLLIWGERDAALGKELTEGLSQMVPRLQVAYLPAGHFVQLEQPDEVSRLLVDYLSRPLPLPTAFESP
ncbi:MAG TPA: alpha/beta fold hydrolase, partial [Pseudomonadota bacterium]|nr:alpha/beta fold hydrolase [Pseudomonadota bacterium]